MVEICSEYTWEKQWVSMRVYVALWSLHRYYLKKWIDFIRGAMSTPVDYASTCGTVKYGTVKVVPKLSITPNQIRWP